MRWASSPAADVRDSTGPHDGTAPVEPLVTADLPRWTGFNDGPGHRPVGLLLGTPLRAVAMAVGCHAMTGRR